MHMAIFRHSEMSPAAYEGIAFSTKKDNAISYFPAIESAGLVARTSILRLPSLTPALSSAPIHKGCVSCILSSNSTISFPPTQNAFPCRSSLIIGRSKAFPIPSGVFLGRSPHISARNWGIMFVSTPLISYRSNREFNNIPVIHGATILTEILAFGAVCRNALIRPKTPAFAAPYWYSGGASI